MKLFKQLCFFCLLALTVTSYAPLVLAIGDTINTGADTSANNDHSPDNSDATNGNGNLAPSTATATPTTTTPQTPLTAAQTSTPNLLKKATKATETAEQTQTKKISNHLKNIRSKKNTIIADPTPTVTTGATPTVTTDTKLEPDKFGADTKMKPSSQSSIKVDLSSSSMHKFVVTASVDTSTSERENAVTISFADSESTKTIVLDEITIPPKTELKASDKSCGFRIDSATTTYIHSEIHNYGTIKAGIAISIGENNELFPLESGSDTTAKLYNHHIISTNNQSAVAIAGIYGNKVTEFELINSEQGIIRGKVGVADNPNSTIEFILNNKGSIYLPLGAKAINVNEFNGAENSRVFIDLATNDFTNNSIIDVKCTAKFAKSSKIIIDLQNYHGKIKEVDKASCSILSTRNLLADTNNLVCMKPRIEKGICYLISTNIEKQQHFYGHEIKVNFIETVAIDFKGDDVILSLIAKKYIPIKDVLSVIDMYKELADLRPSSTIAPTLTTATNPTTSASTKAVAVSGIPVLNFYRSFADDPIIQQAFYDSKSYNEFLDYIIPDNSNSIATMNDIITDKITQSIQNRLVSSKVSEVRSATSLNLQGNNSFIQDITIWTNASFQRSKQKPKSEASFSQFNSIISCFGANFRVISNGIAGLSYTYSNSKINKFGGLSAIPIRNDLVKTSTISAYMNLALGNIDTNVIFNYNMHKHSPHYRGKSLNSFSSNAINIAATVFYNLVYPDFNIELKSLLGLTKVTESKHHNEYTLVTDGITQNESLKHSQNFINFSVATAFKSEIILNESSKLYQRYAVSYNLVVGSKAPKIRIMPQHYSQGMLELNLRKLEMNNISLSALIKLIFTKLSIILNLEYNLSMHSRGYGLNTTLSYQF